MSKITLFLIFSVIVVILILLSGTFVSDVEQAPYKIQSKQGNIEVRIYPPVLVAETYTEGDRENAIKEGFRILAKYIFGENQSRTDIGMTTPVTQNVSEKIAMTAPVLQQSENNQWAVRFVMPAQYTLETLPRPIDNRIKIRKSKEVSYLVISFSGTSSKTNLNKHLEQVTEYAVKNHIEVTGQPIYAFYNPPWTLPFLRRNEIWLLTK